jgi:hypothetical protein
LKDVSGKLIVKDEKLTMENVCFDGIIGLDGAISTKEKVPTFNMDLSQTSRYCTIIYPIRPVEKLAPIAGIINGKLNSTIKLNGNLDATAMRPDLKTVTGDLLGQLLSTTLNANSTLLTALGSNLKFIDANKINLNNLKAAISFKDGMVSVKPLTSIIKISKIIGETWF